MDFLETRLSRDTIFQGRVVNLHRDVVTLHDQTTAHREVVEHPGGVGILAISGEDVLLVRQYRYCIGQGMLEIPAGKLEFGEDPRECGLRELREEVGATPERFTPLGIVHSSPGFLTEVIHLFLAEGLHFGRQHLDPGEFLTVERLPLSMALGMVLSGEITDGKTQIALLRYAAAHPAGATPQD